VSDGDMTRVELRPLASPLPIGFVALASATVLLAALQLEWVAPSEGHDVARLILVFTVPLQALTSVLGFLARDVVAGTGMAILAGTWAGVAVLTLGSPPGSASDALGLFLLLSGLAMCLPAAGAALGKLVVAAVLATAALRFATTGIAQLTERAAWEDAAAYVGLVLGVLAVYAALAMLLEDVRRATVLPLGRRGRAQGVDREAGVREQL
jgi:uncharacterized protein